MAEPLLETRGLTRRFGGLAAVNDVSIALERPAGISILNILPGTVTAIEAETGPIVDVSIAIGRAALTARITRRSVEGLELRVGQPMYALIKAVSFDRRSVGYA